MNNTSETSENGITLKPSLRSAYGLKNPKVKKLVARQNAKILEKLIAATLASHGA